MAASSWGRVGSDGTLAAGSVGITSVARLAAGRYQVTLTTAFSTPDYVIVPRFEAYSGSTPPYAEIDSRMAGSFIVEWYDASNTLADQAFTFAVYSGETVQGAAGPAGSDASVTAANIIRTIAGTPTAGQIPTYTDSTTLTWADDSGGSSASIAAADIIATVQGTPTSNQVIKYAGASTLTWADDEQGSGGTTAIEEADIIDAIGRPKPGQYLQAVSPLDITWAYPDHRYDFELFGDNNSPVGVASDETYLYVVNHNPYHVYVYDHGGSRHADREFDLHADNADPQGIAINDTRIYVSDDTENKIFVYAHDGTRQRSEEFGAHADNTSIDGIAISGTRFYVADRVDDHIYVYDHSGARQTSEEFDLHADNDEARGLDVTATHLYVIDQITTTAGSGDKVFVYSLAGVRDNEREFNTGVDNDRSRGIAITNYHAYIADIGNESIYVYPLVGSSSSGAGTAVEANPASAASSDAALTAIRVANTNYRIVGSGGGSTWHTGTGAPMNIDGANDGDYYLRQDDNASDLSRDNRGDIYTYDGSAWTYRFSILGKRGSIWESGSVDPSVDGFAGQIHDKYLRTTNYDIFNLQIDGSWEKIGNIKGEQGDQGPAGSDGSDASVTAANMISAVTGSPSAGQVAKYTDASTLTWADDASGSAGTTVEANPTTGDASDAALNFIKIGSTDYRIVGQQGERGPAGQDGQSITGPPGPAGSDGSDASVTAANMISAVTGSPSAGQVAKYTDASTLTWADDASGSAGTTVEANPSTGDASDAALNFIKIGSTDYRIVGQQGERGPAGQDGQSVTGPPGPAGSDGQDGSDASVTATNIIAAVTGSPTAGQIPTYTDSSTLTWADDMSGGGGVTAITGSIPQSLTPTTFTAQSVGRGNTYQIGVSAVGSEGEYITRVSNTVIQVTSPGTYRLYGAMTVQGSDRTAPSWLISAVSSATHPVIRLGGSNPYLRDADTNITVQRYVDFATSVANTQISIRFSNPNITTSTGGSFSVQTVTLRSVSDLYIVPTGGVKGDAGSGEGGSTPGPQGPQGVPGPAGSDANVTAANIISSITGSPTAGQVMTYTDASTLTWADDMSGGGGGSAITGSIPQSLTAVGITSTNVSGGASINVNFSAVGSQAAYVTRISNSILQITSPGTYRLYGGIRINGNDRSGPTFHIVEISTANPVTILGRSNPYVRDADTNFVVQRFVDFATQNANTHIGVRVLNQNIISSTTPSFRAQTIAVSGVSDAYIVPTGGVKGDTGERGPAGSGGGTTVLANPSGVTTSDTALTALTIGTTEYRIPVDRTDVYASVKTILEAAGNGGIHIDNFDASSQIAFSVRLVNGQVSISNLNSAVQARLLPALPAQGSRNDMIPKFKGNTLRWEADAGGSSTPGPQGDPGPTGPRGPAGPAGSDGSDANVTAANMISAVTGSPTAGQIMTYTDSNTLTWANDARGGVGNAIVLASGNDNPTGMTVTSRRIYVSDRVDDKIYVYDLLGAHQSSEEFDLNATNNEPDGIAATSTRIYVLDNTGYKIYVYDHSGSRQSSEEFDLILENDSPTDIAFTSTRIYVTDTTRRRVYAYNLSGAHQSSEGFSLNSGNTNPSGIFVASNRIYVTDSGREKVYVYDLSGARQGSEEFDLASSNGGSFGIGIASNRIYVADNNKRIYIYDLSGNQLTGASDDATILNYNPATPLYRFALSSSDDPTAATFDIYPPSDRGLAELESYSGERYLMIAHVAGDGPDEDVTTVEFSDDAMKFNQLGAFQQHPDVVQIDEIGYNVWVSRQALIQPENVTIEVS